MGVVDWGNEDVWSIGFLVQLFGLQIGKFNFAIGLFCDRDFGLITFYDFFFREMRS